MSPPVLSRSTAAVKETAKIMLTRYPRAYDSLRRPYAATRFWMRRPHDRDYRVFTLFPERRGVFLDVGANAGMSALSFRIYNRTSPIVSIEPNPFHEDDLRFAGRLAKPLRYHLWAAGDDEHTMELHVPVYRKVPLTTEASLHAHEVTGSPSLRRRLGSRMQTEDFEILSCRVPVRPLDCLNLDPAFVKLDVQGFEHEALLGLAKTLRRSRPVLLIETPGEAARGLLGELGYQAFTYLPAENRIVDERHGVDNTVFVPADGAGR